MASEGERTCRHCGKPITEGTARKVYCDDGCRYAYRTNKRREERAKRSGKPDEVDLSEEVRVEQREEGLKTEVRYWREKYRLALRVANTQDLLVDALRTCVTALPMTRPQRRAAHLGKASGSHTAVVVLSDLHIGEYVDPDQTGGLSEFDMAIFRNRLGLWVEKVLELVELRRSALYVPKLTVLCAGDLVSGDIHDELVKTNVMNVMDQAVHGAMLLSHAFAQLSSHFEEIDIVGVVGNHGRTTRKKEAKDVHVSWDYLAYQLMAANLQGYEHINFHIPKSFYTIVRIENTRVLVLHGDNIRGWAGFPWYGTSRAIRALRETLAADDQWFDVVVMGHFHQALELDMPTGPLIVNGSFKGGDEFSLSKVYAANKPSQTLFYVHEEEGVVARELIFLSKSRPEHGVRFPSVTPEVWADVAS